MDCKADVCLLIVLLLVLKTSEDPSGFRLQEVPVFVSLQGENFIVKPRFALEVFSFKELLLVSFRLGSCCFFPLLTDKCGCG